MRDLHRRIEQARTRGLADQPTVAGERIVTFSAILSAHGTGGRDAGGPDQGRVRAGQLVEFGHATRL